MLYSLIDAAFTAVSMLCRTNYTQSHWLNSTRTHGQYKPTWIKISNNQRIWIIPSLQAERYLYHLTRLQRCKLIHVAMAWYEKQLKYKINQKICSRLVYKNYFLDEIIRKVQLQVRGVESLTTLPLMKKLVTVASILHSKAAIHSLTIVIS